MNLKRVIVVPAAWALFGCASPVPVADTFPLTYQKVARTAHHWDVVANDVVAQTAAALASNPQLQGRGVFVPSSPRGSAFDTAFRNFMINHLVERGLRVSVCEIRPASSAGFESEAPDVDVRYETQIIGHGADMSRYRPGLFTALASGVAVIRNADAAELTRGDRNAAGIALGALADWGLGHVANPTHTELVVTTTIAEHNRFILRRSDIYYVPDADASLFFRKVGQRTDCPGDARVASAQPAPKGPDAEMARRELFLSEIRRVNPGYPVPASYPAYSY